MDQERKEIDAVEFIRNLPINLQDTKILVQIISELINIVAAETAKNVTAACMGLSVDHPEFESFYNNDIKQIVELNSADTYNSIIGLFCSEGDK